MYGTKLACKVICVYSGHLNENFVHTEQYTDFLLYYPAFLSCFQPLFLSRQSLRSFQIGHKQKKHKFIERRGNGTADNVFIAVWGIMD